ncbi:MAG TPA: hypothetical protein VFA81_08380 [Burkholderiales bacterium]|nr:hypothetical protein [Burkholderiales bacterium]
MGLLREVLVAEMALLLATLAACIFFQLTTGRINTTSLFYGRYSDGTQYFSPERVQLLLATLVGAAYYFGLVLSQDSLTQLPPVPTQLLELLGGSHALYLGGKAFTTFTKSS